MCGQRQLAPRWWRNHMAKADRSSQTDDEASGSNPKERAHRLHALLKGPELRDIQIDKGTRVLWKKPPCGMDERQAITERATCVQKKNFITERLADPHRQFKDLLEGTAEHVWDARLTYFSSL